MATTKKYVSFDKLGLYDEKIKKVISDADAASLKSAKDYADSLAGNYEAAGAVNTAKTELQGKIDAVQTNVDTVSAANVATQGEVDALETYVGTFTHDTAKSVVEYINAKTDGIATSGNLEALGTRVSTVEGKVATIEGDYLKSTDKTELSDAIAAEKERAEGIEDGLETRLKAVEDDYLKAADKETLQNAIDVEKGRVDGIVADYLKGADKTELEGKINAKADQTALDAEVAARGEAISGLQTQINTIMNNPDTEGAINSINEFTQYVADHGSIAEGFRTDIDKNKEDIAAEVKRAGEAESALSGRIDDLEAIDHDAYVGADSALKSELEGKINAKADSSALTSAVEALEGADAGQVSRIEALEAKFGTGEGNVDSKIATAKQEAIDAAALDATSKANTAESNAKGHADSLNTAMNTRVEALEAIDHDHSNKAELDLIASGDKAKWDEAYAKRHEHSNLSVLEGVTAEKITAWDKVSGKAEQTALQGEIDRATAAEEALGARIDEFVECSAEDINGLFA